MEKNMESKDGEYETQFFEFSPSALFEEVKAIISDRLCEGIDQLEYHLQKVPEAVITKTEVSSGISTLRQHTERNFTKTIEKLESHVLGDLMKIPPHILLPSDVEQVSAVTAPDILLLQTEIESLHAQLRNEKFMEAKYKEELQEISEVLEQQENLFKGSLTTSRMECAENFKDNLIFLNDNKAEMKEASNRARETMKTITFKNVGTPAEALSWNSMI